MDMSWLTPLGLSLEEVACLRSAFHKEPHRIFMCSEMELRDAGLNRVGIRKRFLRVRHLHYNTDVPRRVMTLSDSPGVPSPSKNHSASAIHDAPVTPSPSPTESMHSSAGGTPNTTLRQNALIREACQSPVDVLLSVRSAEAFVRGVSPGSPSRASTYLGGRTSSTPPTSSSRNVTWQM